MHYVMREMLVQIPIAPMVIGRNQTHSVRYGFCDETVKSFAICAIDHAGHDIAFALDCADDDLLPMSARPAEVRPLV